MGKKTLKKLTENEDGKRKETVEPEVRKMPEDKKDIEPWVIYEYETRKEMWEDFINSAQLGGQKRGDYIKFEISNITAQISAIERRFNFEMHDSANDPDDLDTREYLMSIDPKNNKAYKALLEDLRILKAMPEYNSFEELFLNKSDIEPSITLLVKAGILNKEHECILLYKQRVAWGAYLQVLREKKLINKATEENIAFLIRNKFKDAKVTEKTLRSPMHKAHKLFLIRLKDS